MKINEVSFSKFFAIKLDEAFKATPLNEALGSLVNIPQAWIKMATSRMAGENSSLVNVDQKTGIKSFGVLDKFVHSALKSSLNNAMTWIEIDGVAVVGIIPDTFSSRTKYKLVLTDGTLKGVTKREKLGWTDKFSGSGAYRKYIPAQYRTYEDKELQANEAIDICSGIVVQFVHEILRGAQGITDPNVKPDLSGSTFENALKLLNFVVKGLSQDKNRLDVRADRKAAANMGRGPSDTEKAAIQKYVMGKIQPLVLKVQSGLPSQKDIENIVTRALNGEDVLKNFDFSAAQASLNKLSRISASLKSALGPYGDGYKKQNYGGGASLSYDMKSVISAIDSALSESKDK